MGLTRVSIGPPISVMVAGAKRSPRASISATAASTGTEGWQTAMTWVSGAERVQHVDDVVDIVVEIELPSEAAPCARRSSR